MKKITIVGAGLAGTLMSIFLAKRGYDVQLIESRPDLRVGKPEPGRSINLALSCRGITALKAANLIDVVEKIMAPMRARAIHTEFGGVLYQAFGRNQDEYISAIKRTELNALLLTEAEKYPNIHTYFDYRLVDIHLEEKKLYCRNKAGDVIEKDYHRIIGADGAASQVREILQQKKLIRSSRRFFPHGYKELSISEANAEGFIHDHLHLWPRNSFLLLGNPNVDHSITGSLFLPHEGKNSFSELTDELSIRNFFREAFPDAFPAMPNLVQEFLEHPTGTMSTIDTAPWYYQDQCLLIGDAAHGIIPFFGQGMNCAFEDCRILNQLLDDNKDDWSITIPLFFKARLPNTIAVSKMSLDNYHEIQTGILDKKFNLKKQLNQELMHRYPDIYTSKHVLVMFTNTPYAVAEACGELQQQLLEEICQDITAIKEVKWTTVDKLMKNYDKKLAKFDLQKNK